MPERTWLRMGAASAFVGALLLLVTHALYPIPAEGAEARLQQIAESSVWILERMSFAAASLVVMGTWVAISRTITTGLAETWARLGLTAAVIGTAALVVAMGVSGFGYKEAAEAWMSAPEAEKAAAFYAARAVELGGTGLFAMMFSVLYGVAPILYGLAIVTSDVYPKWLGWVAVAIGVAGVPAEHVLAFGWSDALGGALFAVSAFLFMVWLVAIGLIMWRRAPAAA